MTPLSKDKIELLLNAAKSALPHAYAPYSGQKVAAAFLDQNGDIHVGVNVENAVNGASICAEQSAIGAARAKGAKTAVGLVVVSERSHPLPPCGVCRQVLSEFINFDTPIISFGHGGQSAQYTLNDLLPHAYGPKDLP